MQAVKHFRILSVLTFGLVVAAIQPAIAERAQGRIYCSQDGNTPTTVIDNGSRTIGLVRWTRDFSPEWNPQKRCEQVSKKFAQNQESGVLVEIVPARANGLPVLCASQGKVNSAEYTCPDAQILMTLRSEDDASNFIDKLWELNTGKSSQSIEHASGLTRVNGVSNLNFSLFQRFAKSADSSYSSNQQSTTNPRPRGFGW